MKKALASGLVLRSLSAGTPQDKARLPQFYVDVFTDAYGPGDAILEAWARDLVAGTHPTVTDDDIWVVVDPAQGERIVSALLLIPQVWRYESVELSVGRVELVATHKDYRHQGLIRELFEVAHACSAALGHNIQAITGIPYFYRQFGYAMAVDLGASASIPFAALPKLDDGKQPVVSLRRATPDDIARLMEWQCAFARNHLMSTVRTADIWRYEMTTRNPQSHTATEYHLLVDQQGHEVGYVATSASAEHGRLTCLEYVVGEQSSYLATFEDIMRALHQYSVERFKDKPPYYIRFDSGLYPTLRPLLERTFNAIVKPTHYAWYLRVSDIVRFINNLKPVLEARLVGSRAHGFTGQLHLSFYSEKGLFMRFEQGSIAEVNDTAPGINHEDAAFPYHTFLNVVFGHRSVNDLERILPDVYANRTAAVLFEALFPLKPSWLIPLA